MIPAETLARLATCASTHEERLAPPFVPAPENDVGRIDARISRWAELGAKGDRERLRRSLHWRGIDLDRMRPSLGDVSLSTAEPLPAWVLRFAALLEATLAQHGQVTIGPPPAYERAAVMTPFVRAAAAALRGIIPARTRDNVAESALAALEQSLLLRLTRLSGPVLASEYYLYSYSDSRTGGEPETRGQRFAGRILQPPIPDFLVGHPVLARLLTLVCDNWQEAALELLGRLAGDRGAIIEQFHEGRDPGPLVNIEVGDADVHDGHREVVMLVFEDGFRIVYKPRSMALDQAFHGFVHWLNGRGLSPSLRSPAVLCRDGYGWAEFIAHRPADGAEELSLFYKRAGVLACVAYVMGATDLHHGNMIAHGGYPILIDLETMLTAEPKSGALLEPAVAGQTVYLGRERSVLQSMLLPLIHRVPTGVYIDLSALGAESAGETAGPGRNWLPVQETPLAEVLRDHASAIEAGFVSAYQLMEGQREALLSDCGPLADFERCAIRVVLRDTALYFQLLRQSIDPTLLRDGVDRAIALERLNHVIAISDTPPSFIDMVTREQAALSRLDVPRFLVMTDETDLRDAAGLVAADVMQRTPLAEMRLRIEAMNETDLQRQCQDIRGALCANIAGRPGSCPQNLAPSTTVELPDAAMLITATEQLAAALLDEAVSYGDTPPPWRGLIYLNAAYRFTVGDAGASFADGGLGIAVLFAALFRVTGNRKWRDAALKLSLLYLTQATNPAAYHGHITGGITSGLGGALYGAALIAALVESEEVLGHGLTLATRLAGRAVAEEKDLSLGDGLAGTLVGIASLQRLAPNTALAAIVERGSARLHDVKPLSTAGLLSGQAGLLLAAHAIGLADRFSIPAELPSGAATDWAEGAVGLSLVALQANRNAAMALDFLEGLASAPMAADDSFASGTAGEVDALVWAAEHTGRPEFNSLALRRMAETVERVHRGKPRLLGGKLRDGLRIPGLFHGTAGIGYAMLRLAAPDRLAALAAFEMPVEVTVA
jgi:lantibiotic modifying enzyme